MKALNPKGIFDHESEELVYHKFEQHLITEEGFIFCHYPTTNYQGKELNPDIIILSRKFGVVIIEIKGYQLSQIEGFNGGSWKLNFKGERKSESPVSQANYYRKCFVENIKKHQISDRFADDSFTYNQVRTFVALPLIEQFKWDQSFGAHTNLPKGNILFHQEIYNSSALVEKLSNKTSENLTTKEFNKLYAIITNSDVIKKQNIVRRSGSQNAESLNEIDDLETRWDLTQLDAATTLPNGPQRIRGLAGSGKTIVLAQKAAQIHYDNPNWNILYTFYSRSLYQLVQEKITIFYQRLTDGDNPNWNKLSLLHGWGSYLKKNGVYAKVCSENQAQFYDIDHAKEKFIRGDGGYLFAKCCQELINEKGSIIAPIFDCSIIDEGQDFYTYYYQLIYLLTKEPKRIYWAYDEFQNIGNIKIPGSDKLFGNDENGEPRVPNLLGDYQNGIPKDIPLKSTYRNQRQITNAAIAIGLGLYRAGGAIQFNFAVDAWLDWGFTVQSTHDEGLMKKGDEVILFREADEFNTSVESMANTNLVSTNKFGSTDDEISWITCEISKLLNEGFIHSDIQVLSVHDHNSFLRRVKESLSNSNIDCHVAGHEDPSVFSKPNSIPISNIYRAKGNESNVVFVCHVGVLDDTRNTDSIIENRNKLFTAMTRAKVFLKISGSANQSFIDSLFTEINCAISDPGKLSFVAPDPKLIQRTVDAYTFEKKTQEERMIAEKLEDILLSMGDAETEFGSMDLRGLLSPEAYAILEKKSKTN